jgi:hypothetical protein
VRELELDLSELNEAFFKIASDVLASQLQEAHA